MVLPDQYSKCGFKLDFHVTCRKQTLLSHLIQTSVSVQNTMKIKKHPCHVCGIGKKQDICGLAFNQFFFYMEGKHGIESEMKILIVLMLCKLNTYLGPKGII